MKSTRLKTSILPFIWQIFVVLFFKFCRKLDFLLEFWVIFLEALVFSSLSFFFIRSQKASALAFGQFWDWNNEEDMTLFRGRKLLQIFLALQIAINSMMGFYQNISNSSRGSPRKIHSRRIDWKLLSWLTKLRLGSETVQKLNLQAKETSPAATSFFNFLHQNWLL